MTAEEMDEREYQQKMRKLAEAELVKQAAPGGDQQDNAKNETFVNQLLTKILNNLQFSVKNIHVRYEDNMSAPGHRFAAGVTLSELSAISTDENWIPQTIGDAVNTIHKVIFCFKLENTRTFSLLESVSIAGDLGIFIRVLGYRCSDAGGHAGRRIERDFSKAGKYIAHVCERAHSDHCVLYMHRLLRKHIYPQSINIS